MDRISFTIICLVLSMTVITAGCSSAGKPPKTPGAIPLCGGGFGLYLVNQSAVPDAEVIHLTDEKIRQYPYMESAIKNPRSDSGNLTKRIRKTTKNITLLETVHFSCDEESQIYRHNAEIGGRYFEYNGTWYYAEYAWMS